MIINNILISDCKERLFSTVNVIKLNYPVMLTKGSPPNVGRYALGTIYYVHICPQGSMLSSSVIKRLNVFFRKQLQTLPTNHGANFFLLLLLFLWIGGKKKKSRFSSSFLPNLNQHVLYYRFEKPYGIYLSRNRQGIHCPHIGFFAHLRCPPLFWWYFGG